MDIIVGLGNPGPRYRQTRHNIGFDVIDLLAARCHVPMAPEAMGAECGSGRVAGREVLLVKPLTYMNKSGRVVAPLVQRYLHAGEQLTIVCDDIDLPLGKIKIKRRGGDAGHLGVRSIIECLGHDAFTRIRVGIGRPDRKEDVVDYVLAPFPVEEAETRKNVIAQAAACIESLLVVESP